MEGKGQKRWRRGRGRANERKQCPNPEDEVLVFVEQICHKASEEKATAQFQKAPACKHCSSQSSPAQETQCNQVVTQHYSIEEKKNQSINSLETPR